MTTSNFWEGNAAVIAPRELRHVRWPPILVEFESWRVLLPLVQRYGLDAALISPPAWPLYHNHNHGFANFFIVNSPK